MLSAFLRVGGLFAVGRSSTYRFQTNM